MIVMLMNNDKMPTHFFVGHTAFGFWKFAMIELRSNLKWRNTIMAWFENEKHKHLQTHRENKKHRFPHVILRKSDRRQYYHKICYNVYLSPSRRRNRLFFCESKRKKNALTVPVNQWIFRWIRRSHWHFQYEFPSIAIRFETTASHPSLAILLFYLLDGNEEEGKFKTKLYLNSISFVFFMQKRSASMVGCWYGVSNPSAIVLNLFSTLNGMNVLADWRSPFIEKIILYFVRICLNNHTIGNKVQFQRNYCIDSHSICLFVCRSVLL